MPLLILRQKQFGSNLVPCQDENKNNIIKCLSSDPSLEVSQLGCNLDRKRRHLGKFLLHLFGLMYLEIIGNA